MTDKQTDKVKVQTKRVRGRNLYDAISQVLELANTDEGWAVTKANMLVMGADVYLERSEKQSKDTTDTTDTTDAKTTKVETDVKAKEEVVEADKPSEKSDEVAVVEEADSGTADKPKQTRSTRSRAKK